MTRVTPEKKHSPQNPEAKTNSKSRSHSSKPRSSSKSAKASSAAAATGSLPKLVIPARKSLHTSQAQAQEPATPIEIESEDETPRHKPHFRSVSISPPPDASPERIKVVKKIFRAEGMEGVKASKAYNGGDYKLDVPGCVLQLAQLREKQNVEDEEEEEEEEDDQGELGEDSEDSEDSESEQGTVDFLL